MVLEKCYPLVDEILASFQVVIGKDFAGYRNHVYRVVNMCCSLGDFDAAARDKIQIAGAFHDIGIWTAGTADYLPPSAGAARDYLAASGRGGWVDEIVEMIAMHHAVTSRAASRHALVEPFRRADTADFSLGLVRLGVAKDLVRQLQREFPNAGFHKRLAVLGGKWFLRHPLHPVPMYRW